MVQLEDQSIIHKFIERCQADDVLIHAALFDPEDYFKCGAIRMKDLKDGVEYIGECRNSTRAIWRSSKKCFEYTREKFGSKFTEDIKTIENFDNFDMFIPIQECNHGDTDNHGS